MLLRDLIRLVFSCFLPLYLGSFLRDRRRRDGPHRSHFHTHDRDNEQHAVSAV